MPAKSSTRKTVAKADDRIGWGIIGCGVIAPTHAGAVNASGTAKLVACCDIVPEKAKAFAEQYGLRAYNSMEAMLADDEVQAVSVCTPSGLHAQGCIAAAAAGRHVLCEKPLDINLTAIDDAIKVCQTYGVKLSGVFQRRTSASSERVREAVKSGKLGKLVLGDAYQKYFRSHEYYASGAWRATWALDGGGALMNQGVHGIDLLLFLMGDVKRHAYARRLVRNIEVEDTAVAIVEFVNGAVGVIEGTTSVTPGYDCKIEISGDDGTIVLDGDRIVKWDVPSDAGEVDAATGQPSTASDPKAVSATGHTAHVIDLCGAIKENRTPEIPGSEARRAVEVIKAIYKSSREGGATVNFPLCYDEDGPGIG